MTVPRKKHTPPGNDDGQILLLALGYALLAFAFVAVSLWGGPLQVVAVIGAATAVALVVSSVPRLRAAAREKDSPS